MEDLLPQLPKSRRLAGFDYTMPGAYFVTLVTWQRELLFEDERFKRIGERCWRWLSEHFADLLTDEFVVMPNHLHGVLIINGVDVLDTTDPGRRPSRGAPTAEANVANARAKPLGQMIGAFKTVSTKQINRLRGTPGAPVWQRNFYDRIVRSESELERIRNYIHDNPAMWDQDPENPTNGRVQDGHRLLDGFPL